MKTSYCHFNGKITTLNKVRINPYDLGILRGYSVFDVMCTQNGKPFLLSEHWKRLHNSAKELRLRVPISRKKYEKTTKKLLAANKFKKSIIRTVLTGGISTDAMSPGKETFCILIEKFRPLPISVYEKGVGVITLDHKRDFPQAKISNYIAAIRSHAHKNRKGALEIIYTNDGKALEASTSNFFIVKDNILITPKEDILLGTTRNLVVKLARKAGYKIQERDVKIKELYSADEVFLTASNKDIVPVVKIDNKKVNKGKIGENTKILMQVFKEFTENY
ncbi:D-alanine aminotransferase [bacterium BMS3Abin15]|nr:D-alanine aminotransferase [bacterium BMS3Abin15]HDZ85281.1 amino acid aminotransferase [Candidatus Moranbacteria bacterium]